MKADAPVQALSTPRAAPGSAKLHNSASLKPSSRACANHQGLPCPAAPLLVARTRQPLSHLGAGPWLRA